MWRDPDDDYEGCPEQATGDHVISDIRLRGPTATWVRCTCGTTFKRATAEGLATTYANHTSGQTYEEVLEQLEAAEEYEELVEAWR